MLSRVRHWLHGDFGRTFLLVVSWQVVLAVLGAAFSSVFNRANFLGSKHPVGFLGHTYFLDGVWFHRVMSGIDANCQTVPVPNPCHSAPAFYPFFPLCIWLLQKITFGAIGFLVLGLIFNTICTWLGATALLKISRHFVTEPCNQWLTVAALLTFPTAFYLHSFYSEASFIALGFWAYLFALQRKWAWMGVLLIPMTASRITAVLFVGLCFLEFWRSKDWKLRGLLSWRILWFPLSFLGFAAYALYLKIVTNEPLAMTHAYKLEPAWSYHKLSLNIIYTLYREIRDSLNAVFGHAPFGGKILVDDIIPLIGLALLVVAVAYLFVVVRGPAIPLAAFGVLSFIMFTLNSNTVSVHRYLLPCLALYIALAHYVERHPGRRPLAYGIFYVNTMMQTFLLSLFITGNWSG
jgi:hypothetical protein